MFFLHKFESSKFRAPKKKGVGRLLYKRVSSTSASSTSASSLRLSTSAPCPMMMNGNSFDPSAMGVTNMCPADNMLTLYCHKDSDPMLSDGQVPFEGIVTHVNNNYSYAVVDNETYVPAQDLRLKLHKGDYVTGTRVT